jgi:5-methylcytosine-specific restriction protein A
MNSAVATHVGTAVARRTGLPVAAVLLSSDVLRLSPTGYHEHESFSVEVRTGWRNAQAAFVPGAYAQPLIRRLGSAPVEARISFAALAELAAQQAKLTLRINQADASPSAHAAWPGEWHNFDLSVRRHGLVLEDLSPSEAAIALASLAAPVLGMIAALVGIDDVEADASAFEGAAVEELSRRYERRAVNREICLSLKGRRCWCCNFDFGQVYGLDADGFIEVHHRIPVSVMGPGYLVHPVRDLFPVCSNCHSVIHLSRPPLDPDALRSQLQQSLGQ